jgi:hypothetical protein
MRYTKAKNKGGETRQKLDVKSQIHFLAQHQCSRYCHVHKNKTIFSLVKYQSIVQ